jgi:hypothetical protein
MVWSRAADGQSYSMDAQCTSTTGDGLHSPHHQPPAWRHGLPAWLGPMPLLPAAVAPPEGVLLGCFCVAAADCRIGS